MAKHTKLLAQSLIRRETRTRNSHRNTNTFRDCTTPGAPSRLTLPNRLLRPYIRMSYDNRAPRLTNSSVRPGNNVVITIASLVDIRTDTLMRRRCSIRARSTIRRSKVTRARVYYAQRLEHLRHWCASVVYYSSSLRMVRGNFDWWRGDF